MYVYIKLISVCKEIKHLKKGKNKPYSLFSFFFAFQILEILPDLAPTLSIFMEEWSINMEWKTLQDLSQYVFTNLIIVQFCSFYFLVVK